MMAYTPYHYAAALHASLAGKDAAQSQKITDAFVSMVARNGHASLGKKIAQEYAVYASEREGIFSGILFVAHPMNPALKKDIAKKGIRKKYVIVKPAILPHCFSNCSSYFLLSFS